MPQQCHARRGVLDVVGLRPLPALLPVHLRPLLLLLLRSCGRFGGFLVGLAAQEAAGVAVPQSEAQAIQLPPGHALRVPGLIHLAFVRVVAAALARQFAVRVRIVLFDRHELRGHHARPHHVHGLQAHLVRHFSVQSDVGDTFWAGNRCRRPELLYTDAISGERGGERLSAGVSARLLLLSGRQVSAERIIRDTGQKLRLRFGVGTGEVTAAFVDVL
mmetsp:Transcript_2983/g.5657  ORF Transcript_2983/g.5657 Transcript_2983/m.5657 type:complete len:217 (+) Transcript_2983:1751-2401(+)